MLYRCISLLLFCLHVTPQAYAQNVTGQDTLNITADTIKTFRQISPRILAAYKHQPRYIGSTSEWHLFLKKEVRSGTGGKQFSTVFGYRIPREKYPLQNGWDLAIPTMAIDPANCPIINRFSDDKQQLFLDQGNDQKDRCLN